MKQPKVIKNPNVVQLLDLQERRRSQNHYVRGIVTNTDWFAWRSTDGDHNLVLRELKIDRSHTLLLRIEDSVIEPNIDLSGTMWKSKSDYEAYDFLTNHQSISKLLSHFSVRL